MPVRQISESDKEIVRKNQTDSSGILRCFISGEIIRPDDEIEYDHVTAYSYDGPSDIINVKVVLKRYNRRKKDQTLFEIRDQLAIQKIYEKRQNNVNLQEILSFKGVKNKSFEVEKDKTKIRISDGDQEKIFPLLSDPLLNIDYFYGRIPIKWIQNDDQEGLQPRVLDQKRLFELSKHLKQHPQLSPAIARMVGDNRILLFDGQHKTAAQVLNGLTEIDLKVYISPLTLEETREVFDRLMITNLDAHSKLRQVPFYTSTLIERFSMIFKELWESFTLNTDQQNHSEENFFNFLVKNSNFDKTRANEILRSSIIDGVLSGSDLKKYVADASKDKNYPLSQEILKKAIFPYCLFLSPSKAIFDSPYDYRNSEIENFKSFSQTLIKKGFLKDWIPFQRGSVLTQEQIRARRIWHKGSVLTWGPMLLDILFNAFNMKTKDEMSKMLYRSILTQDNLDRIETYLGRLFNHPLWIDPSPDIDSLLVSARKQDTLFTQHSLTIGYILTGSI